MEGPTSDLQEQAPPFKTKEDDDDIAPEQFDMEGDDDDQIANNESTEEEIVLARKENMAVLSLRVCVFLVLVCVTLAVCLTVYYTGVASQKNDFENDFQDLALKLVESFELTLKQRIAAIDEFAQDLTAHAINSNSTWPFVALPDYERRAGASARLADLLALLVVPIVTKEEQEKYEQFCQDNIGWRAEGIAIQDGKTVEEVETEIPSIYPTIVTVGPNGPTAETGEGPFLPIWQVFPAIPAEFNVMVNVYSEPLGLTKAIDNVLEHKHLVMPTSYDFLGENSIDPRKPIFDMYMKTYLEYGPAFEDDPAMTWFYPVFDSLIPGEGELVAVLIPDIYWKTFFLDILPSSSKGILVVLSNSCGQQYSYRVDGNDATFVDFGDIHQGDYNHLVVRSDLVSIIGRPLSSYKKEEADAGSDCRYGISVYPLKELEDSYYTGDPLIVAIALAAVFVFTSIVFILYDYWVARRQKIVLQSAMQSGALVSSLFPEDIRKRIYEEQRAKNEASNKKASWHNKDSIIEDTSSSQIAKLYPECTVFFGDLAGFTKWSSGRTPAQVFNLLEALYGEFDAIARSSGVFKIETIGDCWLGATGLPNPQKGHCLLMAKFAGKVQEKMQMMLPDLGEVFGEDTRDLSLRIGLHSGPVTGGVLRGDKSRFQIFGDTVNTASRMETTGKAGSIHVSAATAELLRAASKAHWLAEREGTVEAKGLGQVKTYWLELGKGSDVQSTLSSLSDKPSNSVDKDIEPQQATPSKNEDRRVPQQGETPQEESQEGDIGARNVPSLPTVSD